jgi:multidrug transporter EmrE-like cation transporter
LRFVWERQKKLPEMKCMGGMPVLWWRWLSGLLIKATQTIPIGTAYAVWTGIGAVGTVLVGILVFKEPTTFLRLLFLTTLIASIVGLKVVSH